MILRRRSIILLVATSLLAAACGGDDAADPAAATTSTPTTTPTTSTSPPPVLIDYAESVDISGTALPPLVDPNQDPAIGQVTVTVDGVGFDGTPVSITHDGRPQILLFVAHWCPHCQDEVDELAPWFRDNPPPGGVKLVSIATGSNEQRPNFPPSDWLIGADWPLPVIVDTASNDVGTAYGLTAFPYWVVLDGDGALLARTAGSLPLASVEALLNNLVDLESSS